MAIARPVTKTIISTTAFGIPVVDWINAWTPTAWVNIPLQNGWTADGVYVPQYRKEGDTVRLRGNMVGTVAGSTIVFTLPVGFRPLGDAQFPVVMFTPGLGRVPGVVLLRSNGTASVYDNAGGFGLDVITFVAV